MGELFDYYIDDKDIFVSGPDGLRIAVDYDDVDHDAILAATEKMVKLLNAHWRD